jgi:hypothetical protein
MTTQTEAAERQADGINRAVQHAGQTWVDYATSFVWQYLTDHAELFCDDVWAAGLVRPESPRAFGQVMKRALRDGWMVATDRSRRSVNSNLSIRTVYRSTIHHATTNQNRSTS